MSSNQPLMLLKQNYHMLSERQQDIADYIISHLSEVSALSIGVLANNCNVSSTTVIRLLNKLGYQSYTDFKLDLLRELSSQQAANKIKRDINTFEDGYQSISPGESIEGIVSAVTLSASSTIRNLKQTISAQSLENAANLLCQANSILFFGTGGSASIAMDGFHKFMRLGLNVFYDTNPHFLLIRLAHLPPNSAIILISHTGESHDVLQCAQNAQRVGVKVIGITSYANSSLAKLSTVVLNSSYYDISHYTDALVSRLVQLVLLDILYVTVSLRMEPISTQRIAASREAIASEKKRINARSHIVPVEDHS